VRTALYRWFDAEDRLLYVGITNDIGRRTDRHAYLQPWWTNVARSTVEWFPSRPEALAAEARAIRDEYPTYNRQRPTVPNLNTRWPVQAGVYIRSGHASGERYWEVSAALDMDYVNWVRERDPWPGDWQKIGPRLAMAIGANVTAQDAADLYFAVVNPMWALW
jgi:hypothetical protein